MQKTLPIALYVAEKMKEKGLKKSDLVRLMGYKDISGGINNLDDFLTSFTRNSFIEENLARALGVPKEEVRGKINETIKFIIKTHEENKKKGFRPYLFVITEHERPLSIAMCAAAGLDRFKRIFLPEGIENESYENQIKIIKNIILDYIKERRGEVPLFGKIKGFILRAKYNESIKERIYFNLSGDPVVVDDEEKAFCEGSARLFIKGKDVTSLFQKIILDEPNKE